MLEDIIRKETQCTTS